MMMRLLSKRPGELEYFPQIVSPAFRHCRHTSGLSSSEDERTVLLLPIAHSVNQPIGNPGVEFLLRFVHPQEYIVTIKPLADIERRNVTDSHASVHGKVDEVLDVFTAPRPMAWSRRRGRTNGVAGREDAIQFFIGERRFVGWE